MIFGKSREPRLPGKLKIYHYSSIRRKKNLLNWVSGLAFLPCIVVYVAGKYLHVDSKLDMVISPVHTLTHMIHIINCRVK